MADDDDRKRHAARITRPPSDPNVVAGSSSWPDC
jgi:hypothetical protein